MKTTNHFKKFIVSVVAALSILGSTLTVFAATPGTNSTILQYFADVDKPSTSIGNLFKSSTDTTDATYDAKWHYYVSSDGSTYYFIEEDQESTAVSKINSNFNYNSGNSKKSSGSTTSNTTTKSTSSYTVQSVSAQGVGSGDSSEENSENSGSTSSAYNSDINSIAINLGVDASSGISTATTMLSGFTGILNTLIGIIVVLISLGMTIFSAFDLCYIAFPVFRNKCEEAKQSGNNIMTKQSKNGGEAKLRFVSDDAQYAVVAADTVQSGKNPFVIYFGKRMISYIVLAILLFILMTGNITIFTTLALRVVSGILEVIQSIA
jgi:hypothetical protein